MREGYIAEGAEGAVSGKLLRTCHGRKAGRRLVGESERNDRAAAAAAAAVAAASVCAITRYSILHGPEIRDAIFKVPLPSLPFFYRDFEHFYNVTRNDHVPISISTHPPQSI